MKARAYLLMTLVVLVWGATFALVKRALADMTPLLFNLLRMALATAVLALAYGGRLRRLSRRQIWLGTLAGFFLATGYQLQTAGLGATTPTKSAFLTALVVVLVPLLSLAPRLRAPGQRGPGAPALLGAVAALAGIVLLTTPPSPSGRLVPELAGIGRGDLLTLFCSIAFALHCLTLSRVSARVPFRALALLQIGTATLFMAASLPWLERPAVRWTPAVLAALAISAVLGTAAAFSIQSWVQTILPATHTALILALEPVFAWLTSFLLLGERLGGRAAAGAGLILAGIVATEALAPRAAGTAHEGTAAPPDTPARPAAL